MKGGRVCSFNQYYRSKNCDEILKILSEELNVKRNMFDITDVYMEYKKHNLKIIQKYMNEFSTIIEI